APGGFWERLRRHVGAETDLFEGHSGEIEDAGAANFLDAVDLVVVGAGLFGEAFAGFGDKVIAIAAEGSADRAGFGAGGGLTFALARVAHIALAHFGQALRPFVGRHLEGAGLHAISTAHAFFSV